MEACKCTTLAKYILVFTGIIYLISAGGLSYIGIWVFSTYDHYDEIADSSLTLLPASIILAISALMCIIGILACLAACKTSKKLLSVFFCLILMVLLGEISAGALGFVYRSKVEAVLKEDLMDAINNYNVTVYQEQIDYMQEQFSCCGVQNASDWLSSTYWRQNHSDTVPSSCCKFNQTCIPKLGSQNIYYDNASDWLSSTYWRQNHSDTVPSSCCKFNQTCIPKLGSQNIYYDNASDWLSSTYWRQNHSDTVPSSCCKFNQTCIPKLGSQNIYYDGCLNKLDEEFNKNLIYVIAAAVFLALVQLLALLSACILVCRSTEERQYQTLADQSPSGWRV